MSKRCAGRPTKKPGTLQRGAHKLTLNTEGSLRSWREWVRARNFLRQSPRGISTRPLPILLATCAAFCTRVRDRTSHGYPLPPATQATLRGPHKFMLQQRCQAVWSRLIRFVSFRQALLDARTERNGITAARMVQNSECGINQIMEIKILVDMLGYTYFVIRIANRRLHFWNWCLQ